MVPSFRIGGLVGAALSLALLASPARAQQPNPEEPVAPGAKAEIRALAATVLPIQPTILPMKATVLELRGVGAGLAARTENLQGALKDLGATVKGREIKINLAADV